MKEKLDLNMSLDWSTNIIEKKKLWYAKKFKM